jgi:hypothetical protein
MRSTSVVGVMVALAALAFAAAVGTSAAAVSGPDRTTATLTMNASLRLNSVLGGCAPVGAAEACGARKVDGAFPGLGQVSGAYSFPVDLGPPACPTGDPSETGRGLAYSMRLTVAGKGNLEVDVADGECVTPAYRSTQTFTVVGGTGTYVGASGSGTLTRTLGDTTATGRWGLETWTGTLSVPGREFDVTAPTIAGATGKVVRVPKSAKRVRVRYAVSASDDVDGTVPVACTPPSGSWFRVGKTSVKCAATDTSGNVRSAQFKVTVVRRR